MLISKTHCDRGVSIYSEYCLIIEPVTSDNSKAFLISVHTTSDPVDEYETSKEELKSLAFSLGYEVVGEVSQNRLQAHPVQFIGKGKLTEAKSMLHDLAVQVVVADSPLSPKQAQYLERYFKCKVLDRTQVILEIFQKNAKTREAQLQVELAHFIDVAQRLSMPMVTGLQGLRALQLAEQIQSILRASNGPGLV